MLTRDGESANDLVQETMLRAISNKEKYKDNTNLKAWLYTIMRNIFINNYRQRSKRHTIFDHTDNSYYINSTEVMVENPALSNFVVNDTMTAINKLSTDYRAPFVMHFEGFKYQEIAEKLDLPLGTVKSRIFFARKELQGQLRHYKAGGSRVA